MKQLAPTTLRRLFTWLAPISLPIYFLILAGSNLLGAAFYIVIEASVSRVLRRPITLSRKEMALWAIPILAAAPLAAAIHLANWFRQLLAQGLCAVGRWQTGTERRAASYVAGVIWVAVSIWTTVTCLNAAVGMGLFGNPLKGREVYADFCERDRLLRDLPTAEQQRRQEMVARLHSEMEAIHPKWQDALSLLQEDLTTFDDLRYFDVIRRNITAMPWYFHPSELSSDGLNRSEILFGPLFLAWMLLIRWPGTFAVARSAWLRWIWWVARVGGVTAAIVWLTTWTPHTAYAEYFFGLAEGGKSLLPSPIWFRLVSPAWWLGIGYDGWVRPEWILFNIGLWLALAGLIILVWWLAWRISPFLGWPRYYVAFLASRLLQRKRIAFFSVGAVTLCVAMMIIVSSVMGGFLDTIRKRAHGLLGDLVVDSQSETGFPYYQEFINEISQWKDPETGERLVVQATPLIHSHTMLSFPETNFSKALQVWGIRLDEYVKTNEFGNDLYYNRRYGSTKLTPVEQPMYGWNKDLVTTLPEPMERGYQSYLAGLPPVEREAESRRYRRIPQSLYFPGPGMIKMAPLPETQATESFTWPAPGFEGPAFSGVIIGRDVLHKRMPTGDYRRSEYFPLGEKCVLALLPLTRTGGVQMEQPVMPAFRYVDDSRTGIHDIDSTTIYIDFDILQDMLNMGPMELAEPAGLKAGARCHQIRIKLIDAIAKDKTRLEAMKNRVLEAWQIFGENRAVDAIEDRAMLRVDVDTWEGMQAQYIAAIEKEKFLVLIMFGVVSVVAVFLILCIFYMIVQEKTRDIGILKSVGGSSVGVTAIFLVYGGAIGLVGCILGSMLGIWFVDHINQIQDWLAQLHPGLRVWSPETYSFDRIPDEWKFADILWIWFLAVAASVGGAAFPAIRAGRTWPVESLRYE